jgi:hypothetical protein
MEDPPILGLGNLGLGQFFITNDSRFNKPNLYENCVTNCLTGMFPGHAQGLAVVSICCTATEIRE